MYVNATENWRHVWREHIVPQLSEQELIFVRDALVRDDRALITGHSYLPRHPRMQEEPEAACLLCYGPWKARKLSTSDQLDLVFAQICHGVDESMGQIGGCHHFLCWYDDAPRHEMRREMLQEVKLALIAKSQGEQPA